MPLLNLLEFQDQVQSERVCASLDKNQRFTESQGPRQVLDICPGPHYDSASLLSENGSRKVHSCLPTPSHSRIGRGKFAFSMSKLVSHLILYSNEFYAFTIPGIFFQYWGKDWWVSVAYISHSLSVAVVVVMFPEKLYFRKHNFREHFQKYFQNS